MTRPRDPALRNPVGRPLVRDELLQVRARVADELIVAATQRRVDLDEVRALGRVATLVDRRLAVLADRDLAPTIGQRQVIAAERAPQLNARR